MNGAELENICNEAGILAVDRDKDKISDDEIMYIIKKTLEIDTTQNFLEDEVEEKHIGFIQRGGIMRFNDRTGEENINNFGSKMIIREYRSTRDIDVYFPEYNWTFKQVYYSNFKKGEIKCQKKNYSNT